MERIWNWGVCISAVMLIAGCAQVPQEAIDSASIVIGDAETQEADVFAPELFSAAQDSFDSAQAEIELQNGKFALTRNYDRAAQLLVSAAQLARESAEVGVVRKQEMVTETENLLVQATETAAVARGLLNRAPRGKEGRSALMAITADIDSLGPAFTEVEELLSQGDVKAANERIQAALSRAEGLKQELQQAIDKATSRNR